MEEALTALQILQVAEVAGRKDVFCSRFLPTSYAAAPCLYTSDKNCAAVGRSKYDFCLEEVRNPAADDACVHHFVNNYCCIRLDTC